MKTSLFLFAAACACLLPSLPGAADDATRGPWSFSTATMGTVAAVQIVASDSVHAGNLAYDALLQFHRADSLLSNWTEDSEVARVNREAPGGWVDPAPELAAILSAADRVHGESGGAFDPTIEPLVRAWGFLGGTPRLPAPDEIVGARARVGWEQVELDMARGRVRYLEPGVRIDLGGIAKGFAVDLVAARLDRGGLSAFLVDLSGNMLARGAPPGRESWRIGVRDPAGELEHLGTLALRDAALATSGDYEQFVAANGRRYGHILDPRTGWPVEGMAQVTVVAPDAMLADAWATALFVLGADAGRALAASREDLACILIERGAGDQLILWVEESLRSAYAPHPGLGPRVQLRWF